MVIQVKSGCGCGCLDALRNKWKRSRSPTHERALTREEIQFSMIERDRLGLNKVRGPSPRSPTYSKDAPKGLVIVKTSSLGKLNLVSIDGSQYIKEELYEMRNR